MRHSVRLISVLCIAFLLFFMPLVQPVYSDVAKDTNITRQETQTGIARLMVQNTLWGNTGVRSLEISIAHAEEISDYLQAFKQALLEGNERRAYRIATSLTEEGVFKGGRIFSFIHRYCQHTSHSHFAVSDEPAGLIDSFCLVMGGGEGVFYYPIDLLVSQLGFLLFLPLALLFFPVMLLALFLYYELWMPVSHATPRLVLPWSPFEIWEGSLTTVGLNGSNTININRNYAGHLIGFAGVMVSLIIPTFTLEKSGNFLFFGSALAVLGKDSTVRPSAYQ